MAKVSIKVIDNSQVFMNAKDKATQEILNTIGQVAVSHSQNEYVPYLKERGKGYSKGDLHDSIGYEVDNKAVRLFATQPYASYVELGTSYMDAQPFIKPAMENHRDEYKEIAESIYRDDAVDPKFRRTFTGWKGDKWKRKKSDFDEDYDE